MTTIAELGVVVRSQGIQQAGRDLDKFNQSAGKADRATAALATTAKRAVAALAATGAAYLGTRAILENARAYENLTGKMRLYLQDQKAIFQAQTQLFGIAQRSGVELSGVVELYTKLSGASEDLRNNQGKLLRVVELFSKGLAVSGADAAAAAASTRQFAQALASGTLRGDEFVSVMEGAPRVAKALADGLGVSTGKLRELAAQGKLTSETVTEALLRGGQTIDAEYKRMPLTLDRAVQRMKNSWLQLIGQTNEAGGATREMAKAIDGLGAAMSDPRTIAAFQGTVTRLAKVAAAAMSAVGALNEYFAANSGKSLQSLQNRRTELETELFGEQRAQRRSWLGSAAEENAPRVRALKAEIAEIDRLIEARKKAARTDWVEGRVVSKPGTGRWADVTSEGPIKPLATLDTGTGKVKALRSVGDAAKEAAGALQDYTFAESALEHASFARIDVQTRSLEQFARIRAELSGPLAVAELDHIQRLQDIERLGKEAGVGGQAIVDAQNAQRAAYSATTAAILEQQRVMANPEVVRTLDTIRRAGTDALTDLVTGARSAKDAFRDFFDSIAEQITRAIAEQWMTKLFGQFGTSGAGTSGGGFLASLLGGLFGGGRAIGGPVSGGRVYQVNERGAPEIYTAGGKQFLLAPRDGRVTPATATAGGRMSQINQTFVVNGTPDRMTRQQMLRAAGAETSRAVRRS